MDEIGSFVTTSKGMSVEFDGDCDRHQKPLTCKTIKLSYMSH